MLRRMSWFGGIAMMFGLTLSAEAQDAAINSDTALQDQVQQLREQLESLEAAMAAQQAAQANVQTRQASLEKRIETRPASLVRRFAEERSEGRRVGEGCDSRWSPEP